MSPDTQFSQPRRGRRLPRKMASAAAVLLVVEAALTAGGTAVAAAPEPKPAPARAQQPSESEILAADMAWAAARAKGSKAWAILEAKKTGKTVVVTDETTGTTYTVANPDGTLTTELTSGPERVLRGGKWQKVDVSLARAADGSVRAKNHPKGLRLGGKGGAKAASVRAAQDAAPRELVTLGQGDEAVTLQWKGGLPAPAIDGTTARYRDAVPGADVIVEATRTGFEQFVQIRERPATGDYTYTLPVRAKGLKAEANKDGSVTFADARTGAARATMPAPVMWDSSVDERSGKHENRARVGMKVVDKGNGAIDLVVNPDTEFLTDPTTVYPVTVDPSTSALGNTFDTYVQQGETVDWSADTELDLGNPGTKNADGTYRTARSFVTWNTAPIADALVSKATLSLWNFHSGNTDCTAQPWEVWTANNATTSSRWTNQPAMGAKYATSTATRGNPGCTATDGWITADVTTLAQYWAGQKWNVSGMGLRASSESDIQEWKRVNSANNAANQPKLSVTYNYRPSDGTSRQAGAPFKSYAGVWAVNTTTPILRDTFTDKDGDQVNGTFQVYDAATNSPITTPLGEGLLLSPYGEQGKPVSVTVPAGQLKDGRTYKFRTNAYDGTHYNLNWSPWTQFVVDTTAPPAPSRITSPDYPEGAWTPNKGDGKFDITPAAGDDVRGVESRTNGGAWSAEKPAVAGQPSTVTGTPAERDMNRTEGRTVDRADNKGPGEVYDYGTGKAPISGDAAVPDSGEQPEEPVDPEEEPYEEMDTPEKQASPDGVTTDPQPGDRSHCHETDNPEIELCQSRTYNAEIGRAAEALAAPANSLVPWCNDPTVGGYTLTRDEGCHKIGVVAQWWRISTNEPPKLIGTAMFLVREEIKLNTKGTKGAEWLQQNTIAPLSIDGALGTVTLDYWDVTCGGDTVCQREFIGPEFTGPTSWTTTSSVTEQTVQTRKFTWKTAAAGQQQKFDRGNFLGFKASAAPASVKITEPSWVFWEQVRCDQIMRANTSVGCVFPKYTPTFNLKLKNAEGAALYYLEMRDKLDWHPGSKKYNSPLRREFDGAKADANRGVVCPKSGTYQLVAHPLATPDPANKNAAVQCDEYAFASTKESGGATGVANGGECLQAYARKGGDGKWRVYDDERPPFGGTPTYKEKCARASMHGGQNETAGRRLNGFYSKQRMLDEDPYFIDAPGLVRP
ncbi:DNRLRE domain-containing protein [Streptomyces pristinaespiralis]|uniref:DNRLRE domain-containing protein n=1 Tax=Streptomyces pristinaespiralis TaxID=38300 RepID=UPI003838CD0C